MLEGGVNRFGGVIRDTMSQKWRHSKRALLKLIEIVDQTRKGLGNKMQLHSKHV